MNYNKLGILQNKGVGVHYHKPEEEEKIKLSEIALISIKLIAL